MPENRPKTLEEIEALPKEMLTPSDIAGYIGCHPHAINLQAKECDDPFPFPIIKLGRQVKIPKTPFLKAMRGETA